MCHYEYGHRKRSKTKKTQNHTKGPGKRVIEATKLNAETRIPPARIPEITESSRSGIIWTHSSRSIISCCSSVRKDEYCLYSRPPVATFAVNANSKKSDMQKPKFPKLALQHHQSCIKKLLQNEVFSRPTPSWLSPGR